MEEQLYYIGSFSVAVLAVWSTFVAFRSMKKGLTYSSMAAVAWTMALLAIGRIWHSTYEVLRFPHEVGSLAELVEYAFYILAYGSFIWLSLHERRIEDMSKSTSGSVPKAGA